MCEILYVGEPIQNVSKPQKRIQDTIVSFTVKQQHWCYYAVRFLCIKAVMKSAECFVMKPCTAFVAMALKCKRHTAPTLVFAVGKIERIQLYFQSLYPPTMKYIYTDTLC